MRLVAALRATDEKGGNFSVDAAKALFRRRSERRSLTLSAVTSFPSAGETQVVIRDISAGGLLMETEPDVLATGDLIELTLPERGKVQARVVWQSGPYSGCQFSEPASAAAISAALLKAGPNRTSEPEPTEEAEHFRHGSGTALEPQLNFSVAVGLSLTLWGVIIAAAYFFIL